MNEILKNALQNLHVWEDKLSQNIIKARYTLYLPINYGSSKGDLFAHVNVYL